MNPLTQLIPRKINIGIGIGIGIGIDQDFDKDNDRGFKQTAPQAI